MAWSSTTGGGDLGVRVEVWGGVGDVGVWAELGVAQGFVVYELVQLCTAAAGYWLWS